MERKEMDYSPIWIANDDDYAHFVGNYFWDSDNEVFEIAGIEATALEIPTDKDNTHYLMKKIDHKWRIALRPNEGDPFTPINTQLTDKILVFILNKHEWDDRIVYPHNSHPNKS